ncbi:ankyrin repeat-containing domain protein, partial [Aspergillus foveolatus]|uniref:ankyrin repeat-containing domain protein n=1 Tax=Aspergillus foveolatus TaxID=210207 RepID=UPI003CCE2AFA
MATTVQSPSQVMLCAPLPPNAASASPGPPTQEIVFDAAPLQPSNDFEPWTQAFKMLQIREPELMGDYKKHLASVQGVAANHEDLSTSRSVESVVKQLLNDREKKQWQVSLLGKEVKVREQAEKLVKFLLWSDPIVKDALSAQPYAALAWCGVSLLLPLLISGTTKIEAMLRGFNSISDVQIYWEICEKTYLRSPHRQEYQDLMQPLVKLYAEIIEYQARAICHLSKAQLSRAWRNVTGWNDWDGKAADINNLSKRCSSYIPPLEAEEIRQKRDSQLQQMQDSRAILDEIRMILETGRKQSQTNYEDQKERNLLQVLASCYEDYKDFHPPRVQGTCEWFFTDDRFRKWRGSNTSSLLWVSAGPGCGKSVLSRALVDERRLSTNITTSTVCYFFFKDGEERRMYATNALCTILHQLFTHNPASSLMRHALPSHKNYGKDLTQNFSELWRILEGCANLPDAGEIVCVLDALDECNAVSRRQLINKLREFYCQPWRPSNSLSKLKFLITSRPYDDLETSFKKLSNQTTYLRLDGDERYFQISKEINLVIDAKLDEIARDFGEDDRQTISQKLKSMENRTYLWLHLIFDIIEQSPGEYGRRSDVEALLSNLPSRVSEAYEKILDRSKNELQTETLLQIVLAAARPLTLDEANIALTLALHNGHSISHDALESKLWSRKGFKSTVTNLCGLFINVYDSKLSFMHETARDFLIHPKRHGKWQGRLDMSKSHSKMSVACLTYLSYIDEQSPLYKIKAKFPLAQYAAQYWMDNARRAETEKNVQESVLNFFLQEKQAYRVWGKLFDPDRPWVEEPNLCGKMATPLYYASSAGLQRTVELLLEKGANSNAQGGDYGNALQAAAHQGHIEVVQLLLGNGANVNIQGGKYGNGLQAASVTGHKEIVQLLLENRADVNAQGGVYGNALQAASYQGHKEVVQLLLENSANVNAQVGYYSNSLQGGYYGNALQAASLTGHKEIVQLLLEKGANADAQGGDYGNALQAASYQGHKEVVQLLLNKRVNTNAQGGRYGNALQAASYQGHKEIVQLLLEKDANANAQGGRYGNALQAASYQGHKEVVQLLLENRADANAQGGDYGNPLQAASYQGHKDVMQLLLENSANVNAQGGKYGNALQAASLTGHKEVVQLLLEGSADVNAQGGYYGNALQAASLTGHKEIVQLLLEKSANTNAQGGRYGNALQAASYQGDKEIVQLLLENSADVNAQGGKYGNALQAVSLTGHKEVVQLLLENRADVNTQGGVYGNALQAASYQGHKEVVQLLLENRADVNAQGGVYGNPLQAASYQGHKEVVQLLLENSANVNAQGGKYGNALQAASYQGHKEIVKLLLEKGTNTNGEDGDYSNALQAASCQGHKEIVQLLLEKGANTNAQGEVYGSALQAASYQGHKEIVQLLLEKGANTNAQSEVYGSALQAASYQGHKEIVQLLLGNGADVNIQGGYDGSALYAASYQGHEEVVQLLLENSADVNAQGGDYGNPLQAASLKGHKEIMQSLLEGSADVNAQGGYYGNALQAASLTGHKEI